MLPLKAKLLTILLVCCMLKPFAQTSCSPVYVNQYASTGHMEPYTIKALADSTFLIAGRGTANGRGPYDGMVMHVTATGTIIWSFLIGGAADDEFTGIAVLADSSFILSGSTASYGHPESKGWLVLINKNGNLVWSRQIGSTHAGTDRIKAVTQYSDHDIIGTFNEDDSTILSNPVVFKIAEDGTMRWCTKFDNGNDDSYTSIAFSGDTIYSSGYYTSGTLKKGVITQLNATNGALINARNIYHGDPYDQEIAGLEIFNNTVSYGLWLHGPVNVNFPFNGTVYVQTGLAGTKQMVLYCDNGGDIARMIPFRTMDSGFYMLRPHSSISSQYYFANVCKMNRFGKMEWGRFLDSNSSMANMALAVTADNGLVAASFYNDNASHYLNQMRLVRMNKDGEVGDCQLNPTAIYTDTLGYNETSFSWSSVTAENSDQEVITSAETANSPTLQNLCLKNVCIDKTPLPPGCNKNYLIEYDGAQIILFRDAITTPDGGRITIGDNGSSTDGLAIKTDVNGQPVWSKRFENFRSEMKFVRIIRSADNNYWIFANEYVNINQGLYIDLIKMDTSGNMLTSVQLDQGSSVQPFSEVEDVVSAPDGGFILMVNNSMTFNSSYSFIFRYDANAVLIWQKEITHPGFQPMYKSISCSPDAVFLAYDHYDGANYQNFGVERVDLNTGNLMWYKRYTIGNNNARINRIFSINDTTYTFVNNFTASGLDSITHTVMVKVDPAGNLIESLMLKGETITPGSWYPYFYSYQSPPTITMTSENDFVLCGKASVNGTDKLNIVRFDKTGSASWSRNFESAHSLSPENIHQQGTGFLIMGETVIVNFGFASFANGFLLKVDGSGQIMNNATGDCQPVNRSFSEFTGSIHEVAVEPRQANDITGTSWKPVNIISQDIDVYPTSYCTQKGTGGGVSLKQRGNACSSKDTLVFFLQDAAASDASATWQYDTLYFHSIFSNGDSILLQPVREGQSMVKASVEGNCFLDNQQINTLVSRAASTVNLGPDTAFCTGKNNSIKLSAGPGFTGYLWNDGSTDSTLTVNSSGKYYVQVSDLCDGKASDSIRIDIKDCEALLVFPNAFTPNHDGLNDVFRLKYPGLAADYNLQIFNRWGQKIFETSDPSAGWDGDFSGQQQPEGTYIWIVRYTDHEGKKQNMQGSVVLIR